MDVMDKLQMAFLEEAEARARRALYGVLVRLFLFALLVALILPWVVR